MLRTYMLKYLVFIGIQHFAIHRGYGALALTTTPNSIETSTTESYTTEDPYTTENPETDNVTSVNKSDQTPSYSDSSTSLEPTSIDTTSSSTIYINTNVSTSIEITRSLYNYTNTVTPSQLSINSINSFITSSIPSSSTLGIFTSTFTLTDLQTSTGITSTYIMSTKKSTIHMSSAVENITSSTESSEFSTSPGLNATTTSTSSMFTTSASGMGPLNTSDYLQPSSDKTYFSTSDLQPSSMTSTIVIQPSASYNTYTQYETSSSLVSEVSSRVISTPGTENVGSGATSQILPTSHISMIPSSSDLFMSTTSTKMEMSTSPGTTSPNPLQGQLGELQQRYNDLESSQSQLRIAVGILCTIIVLLILAIVLYVIWRRRRIQQKQKQIFSTDDDLKADVQTRHKPYMNTHVALGSGPDGRYSAASLGESDHGGTQLNTFGGTKQPASANGAPKLETVVDAGEKENESKEMSSNEDVSLDMENLPPPPSPGDFNKEDDKEETSELLKKDDDKT